MSDSIIDVDVSAGAKDSSGLANNASVFEVNGPLRGLGIPSPGGMRVVYKAYDNVMKRNVALKTLLDIADLKAIELFHKECEDLASLIHPNIVEIFDIGKLEVDGETRPFLVMPLLPGVTLEKLIRASSQRLTVERSIEIICQTCRGLQAAHERGLVHRDLKPSNIFVMEDDSVKIIDFAWPIGWKELRRLGGRAPFSIWRPSRSR